MREIARLLVPVIVALAAWSRGAAAAQEHIVLRSDVLLYGDNTEFRNPFREGETIFGAAPRVAVDLEMNERVTLSLGVFANERFGSDRAFQRVRPIVSVTTRGARSSFVFGTLPGRRVDSAAGPDRSGPHGLLPPLQRETLAFERPYEAGLQWTFAGTRLRHEIWLEWQRLNTPEHRERFDGGLNADVRVSRLISLPLQIHVVHEGGQLFASGAVADSPAAAGGVRIHGSVARTRTSLELYGLVSTYVPDRSVPGLSQDGAALFARAEAERAGWRGHAIVWRGRHFIKDEGDPNYLSLRRGGARYEGIRDYAEAGLTRRFRLASTASLEVSARLHRTEKYYEYSYRILSIVSTSARIH